MIPICIMKIALNLIILAISLRQVQVEKELRPIIEYKSDVREPIKRQVTKGFV